MDPVTPLGVILFNYMEILVEKFELLKQALKETQSPLLVIHPKPDADALGSAFALSEYLKLAEKKQFKIFSIDKPGDYFEMLFPVNQIVQKYDLKNYDSLIFIDRGDIFYKLNFSKEVDAAEKKPRLINIDHHPHTFIPGALNVLDTKSAATCEIIYRFFDYVQFPIDVRMAQYLLNGIFADTGGFRHNNTTPQSLEIASLLMKKGATITKINRALFANKSLNTLKLWGIALERAKIDPKSGMVVSFITKHDLQSCHASADDISGISEILNTIADSKFSLVLSEREQDKIKASLRSEEYKGIDVSKIARQFQGGGHKLASGFEIKGRLRQVGDSWIIE